jgi:hypothetical protein
MDGIGSHPLERLASGAPLLDHRHGLSIEKAAEAATPGCSATTIASRSSGGTEQADVSNSTYASFPDSPASTGSAKALSQRSATRLR